MNNDITKNAKEFVTAGNASFTIENTATGGRFTFKVTAPGKDPGAGVRFVKVLTGTDNTADYTFLGTIFLQDLGFRWSPKSRLTVDAPSFRAFAWFWARVTRGADLATVRVLHEGKCGRCGRKLTVPESIETGLGPECAGRMS